MNLKFVKSDGYQPWKGYRVFRDGVHVGNVFGRQDGSGWGHTATFRGLSSPASTPFPTRSEAAADLISEYDSRFSAA